MNLEFSNKGSVARAKDSCLEPALQTTLAKCHEHEACGMRRLNSGITNRHNFLSGPVYVKNGTDSGDIKNLVQCYGYSILKILLNFLSSVTCPEKYPLKFL